MKYAIIAAGNGSRLAKEGITVPKPLVQINGETLIDRLIRVFCNNNATEIVVVCNEEMTDVATHLAHIQQHKLKDKNTTLRFIAKSTPSSMHSFEAISKWLTNEPFVLTTVDTIFNENEFKTYIDAFTKAIENGVQAYMGVTPFVDDEKPLYVGTDNNLNITGFYDQNIHNCSYISGGIYGLHPKTLQTLHHCIEQNNSRMRNFQRALIADGYKTIAHVFTKVIDIDHAADIEKAEIFLNYIYNPKNSKQRTDLNRFDELILIEENEIKRKITKEVDTIIANANLLIIDEEIDSIETKRVLEKIFDMIIGKRKKDKERVLKLEELAEEVDAKLRQKYTINRNYKIHDVLAKIMIFKSENLGDSLVKELVDKITVIEKAIAKNFVISEEKVLNKIEELKMLKLPVVVDDEKEKDIEYELALMRHKYEYDNIYTDEEVKYVDTTANEIKQIIEYIKLSI